MPRYALVDSDNNIVNVIEWDGSSDWTPPDGLTIIQEAEETGAAGMPPCRWDAEARRFVNDEEESRAAYNAQIKLANATRAPGEPKITTDVAQVAKPTQNGAK